MASTSKPIMHRLLGAIVFGIFGYIIGNFLADIGIFPNLLWSNIGLFLGVIYGGFKDEIEGLL